MPAGGPALQTRGASFDGPEYREPAYGRSGVRKQLSRPGGDRRRAQGIVRTRPCRHGIDVSRRRQMVAHARSVMRADDRAAGSTRNHPRRQVASDVSQDALACRVQNHYHANTRHLQRWRAPRQFVQPQQTHRTRGVAEKAQENRPGAELPRQAPRCARQVCRFEIRREHTVVWPHRRPPSALARAAR